MLKKTSPGISRLAGFSSTLEHTPVGLNHERDRALTEQTEAADL